MISHTSRRRQSSGNKLPTHRLSRLQKLFASIIILAVAIVSLLVFVELIEIKTTTWLAVLMIFCLLYITLIFFIMEYYHYRKWYKMMRKKLGVNFDEHEYSFRPIFNVKEKLPKNCKPVHKNKLCAIYETGIKANFMFEKHKSVLWEFKKFDEIDAIYPLQTQSSKSKLKRYDGIQIETNDLKVCVFSTRSAGIFFPKIIQSLVVQLGNKWDKLFKKNSVVKGKRIGIHHWLVKSK